MSNIFFTHRFSGFLTGNYNIGHAYGILDSYFIPHEQVETCSFYISHAYGIKAEIMVKGCHYYIYPCHALFSTGNPNHILNPESFPFTLVENLSVFLRQRHAQTLSI